MVFSQDSHRCPSKDRATDKPDAIINRFSSVIDFLRSSMPAASLGKKSVMGWFTLRMYPLSIAIPINADMMLYF